MALHSQTTMSRMLHRSYLQELGSITSRRSSRVSPHRTRRLSSRAFSPLQPPTVLFSDNHLLVVNKPVGWHSVPNPTPSAKCILSELKRMQLGGGSKKDFLKPLHRIDQPCSGILLLGKTSKAASRITTLWKKRLVEKEYLCVVSASRIMRLENVSSTREDGWYSLHGQQMRSSGRDIRSVTIRPIIFDKTYSSSQNNNSRDVSIEWQPLHVHGIRPDYGLIRVKTSDGARHMVRAMLAQVGSCPVEGDIRYNRTAAALQDQSVALHAVFLSLDKRLKLGTLETFDFQAPIPTSWKSYFGIKETGVVDL